MTQNKRYNSDILVALEKTIIKTLNDIRETIKLNNKLRNILEKFHKTINNEFKPTKTNNYEQYILQPIKL